MRDVTIIGFYQQDVISRQCLGSCKAHGYLSIQTQNRLAGGIGIRFQFQFRHALIAIVNQQQLVLSSVEID